MPVTARLSLKFYERFGEDIANELVEWFNAVDSTYRSELTTLNDLNFARFEAKLEQRVAELRTEFRELRGEIRAELREVRADLLKWMFVFVAGGTVTVLGVLITILKP